MAWVQAFGRLREIFAETAPMVHLDIGRRFIVDESEEGAGAPPSTSRTFRLFPTAFGTNAADQTPGNRRTFVDIVVEVAYRPRPRARTSLIEAVGADYEALRDALMDTARWGSATSGIIALSVGGMEVKPADVSYDEAGTTLTFSLALEYEDPQEP